MNLFLQSIGETNLDNFDDSLLVSPQTTYDHVLANQTFGKKSSMTFTNEEGEQEWEDLTYNAGILGNGQQQSTQFCAAHPHHDKTTGKAAVVVRDNVLFDGGAGEAVCKKLLERSG